MSSSPSAPPRRPAAAEAGGPSLDVEALAERFRSRRATFGVIGLGYVGLPLLRAAAASGFRALGFDIDAAKVEALNDGRSYIDHIPGDTIAALKDEGRLSATADFARLAEADAIAICVPTPLTRQREPDLSFVKRTAEQVAARLRAGQLVVLESTTYPGTTREVVRPILEQSGLVSGRDFFLAYSPEREDPGNANFGTSDIPRVVGGDGEAALRLASALYSAIVNEIVPASSLEAAEAVKLTENIFRSVNIALVNELKLVYEAMGIDVWEVIEAAKTKPFGYMPFYPGPGLGGHCIPIDPFYLTWKAREFDRATHFVELAGEINTAMPRHVVGRLAEALSARRGVALNGARVLILGVAYKKNVGDTRESPALKIMALLEERGARVGFHDPHCPELPVTREYPHFAGRRSAPLDRAALAGYDAALICTDHDSVDYGLVVAACPLVIDTRNVCARLGLTRETIVKA